MYREISSPPSPSAEPKFPGQFRTRPMPQALGTSAIEGGRSTLSVPRNLLKPFRVGASPRKGRAGGASAFFTLPK